MQNQPPPRRAVSRTANTSRAKSSKPTTTSVIVGLPLTENGEFSPHFGAAAQAGLFTVDAAQRRIVQATAVRPPLPEPCGWADWLAGRGVKVFLAGGMGRGAQERMTAAGVEVITGVPADLPALLVQAWANGTLQPGENGCEGGPGHAHQDGDHHHENCCGAQ